MESWRIRLFGGLSLEHNGQTAMMLRTRKDDLVLAYLALAPATTHVRTTVVVALWPQAESAKARKILSFNLFSLKARLEAVGLRDALVETRTTLRLAPHISTDVQEFTELVQRAAALGGDQGEERGRLVNQALELYGEGLLPSYQYAWLEPHRSRIEALHREATAIRLGVPLVAEGVTRVATRYGPPGAGGIAVGPLGAEDMDVAAPTWRRVGGVDDLRELRDRVAELEPLLTSSDRWSAVQEVEDLYESRLREVLAQSPRPGTIELLLSIATGIWRYWYLRAHYAEGATTIERLLSSGLPASPRVRAKALHAAGTLAYFNGDHEHATTRLQEAMGLWQTLDDDDGLLRTLVNLGMCQYGLQNHERALELYEQASSIATRNGNDAHLSTILFNASLSALQLERAAKANELLNRRLALAPAVLDASARASTHVHLAAAALIEEDDDEARRQAERAWLLVKDSADHQGRSVVLSLLGRCEQRAGHLDRAIAWYEQSLDEAKTSGDVTRRAESLSYLAVAYATAGDRPIADQFAEQARQLYRLAGSREAHRRFEEDLSATRKSKQGA